MTRQGDLARIRGYWRNKIDGRVVRVMGVVEGYVVVRRKGAIPFVATHKSFLKSFDPTPRPAPERPGGDDE